MRVKEDAMSMVKEFKEFALKGNVIDLAIAVVIGAAFAKIITSFVDDILTPALGVLIGKHDLSSYFVTLSPGHYETLVQAKAAGAATLNYGIFLNTVINFLIVAFCVFIIIQMVNHWVNKPAPPAPSTTKDCPQCAMTIPIAAKRCGHCTSQLA